MVVAERNLIRTGGEFGSQSSLIVGGIGDYHRELDQYSDEWWDKQSGDGYYFDNSDGGQTEADRNHTLPVVQNIYTNLSKTIFRQRYQMYSGYVDDKNYTLTAVINGTTGWYHSGIDIDPPDLPNVKAAVNGKIAEVSTYNKYGPKTGYAIAVDETDPIYGRYTGRRWWYLHLDGQGDFNNWTPGDIVEAGVSSFGKIWDQQGHLHLTVQNANFNVYLDKEGNDVGWLNFQTKEAVLNNTISPIHAFWKAQNVINEPGNLPISVNVDPETGVVSVA
jgi:hypothetical protein